MIKQGHASAVTILCCMIMYLGTMVLVFIPPSFCVLKITLIKRLICSFEFLRVMHMHLASNSMFINHE